MCFELYSGVELISAFWKDIRKPKAVLHGRAWSKPKMMISAVCNSSHRRRIIVLCFVHCFAWCTLDCVKVLTNIRFHSLAEEKVLPAWAVFSKIWCISICFSVLEQYWLLCWIVNFTSGVFWLEMQRNKTCQMFRLGVCWWEKLTFAA